MKDIKLSLLDEDSDSILIDLPGVELQEIEDPSQLLLQKIIIALNQEEGSNIFSGDGFSLKQLLRKKYSRDNLQDLKLSVYFLMDSLQKSIIAEQEKIYEDAPIGLLLEKIELLDVEEDSGKITIHLNIYNKAGQRIYLRT